MSKFNDVTRMKSFFAGERKPGFTVLVPDDVCLSDRAKGVLPGRGSRKQSLHFYRVASGGRPLKTSANADTKSL